MRTRLHWISIGLGALLLIGAPSFWYLAQPADSVGELPAAFVAPTDDRPTAGDEGIPTADGDATPDASASPTPEPDEQARAGSVTDPAPDQQAAAPEPEAARPARPVSLSVPSIGIGSTDLVEVQLDDNRAVEIPEDVRQVGWYSRGPRPGEPGNAFMTSHVDSRTQGRGVLFDLRLSEPGDPITVTHADGATSDWVVVARERYNKGEYPLDQVFRFDGPAGLVIDTCGGRFDASTGSYEDIVTVYAVPADSEAAAGIDQA